MSRNEKKRGSKRRRKKKLLLLFFMLLAIGLLCTLSLTVFFPVENIEITQSSYYSTEQIEAALGIKKGDNLLVISEKSVLENIQQQLPFVDNIKLTKKLPDTVSVKVSDAQELCCYSIDGAFYSTDKKGRVLGEYYELPENLLYIEGKAVISQDKIRKVKMETQQHSETVEQIIKAVENLSLKTEYIDVTDLYEVRLGIDDRFTVELGEAVYIEEKLALLIKMLESKTQEDSGVFRLDMWNPDNPKGSYFENDN